MWGRLLTYNTEVLMSKMWWLWSYKIHNLCWPKIAYREPYVVVDVLLWREPLVQDVVVVPVVND